MQGNDLAQRIQLLEDIEDIKKLKAKYCYYADAMIAGDKSKQDDFLNLYAKDAKVDYPPVGPTKTRDELVSYFTETLPSLVCFSAHMVHNPIIEVNGDKATGVWHVDSPCTSPIQDKALWINAIYEEEYVKEGGQWKISFIKATMNFITPFDEGWVKTKLWMPGLE
jgi:hypothetical protein